MIKHIRWKYQSGESPQSSDLHVQSPSHCLTWRADIRNEDSVKKDELFYNFYFYIEFFIRIRASLHQPPRNMYI